MNFSEEEEAKNKLAMQAIALSTGTDGQSTAKKPSPSVLMEAKMRNLEAPDYTYKGFFYADGVVENGVKIMPKINNTTANATNLFKRSLFRVECRHMCEQNTKLREL